MRSLQCIRSHEGVDKIINFDLKVTFLDILHCTQLNIAEVQCRVVDVLQRCYILYSTIRFDYSPKLHDMLGVGCYFI